MDVVRIREDVFDIAVVVLERGFDLDVLLFARHVTDVVQGLFVLVELLDKALDAAFVTEILLLVIAFIAEVDAQTAIEERQLAKTLLQDVERELECREDLAVGLERLHGAGAVGDTDDFHLAGRHAANETLLVDLLIAHDASDHPLRQRVGDRYPHAVQTARNFVTQAFELAAGVQHRHDDFERGLALRRDDVHGNAAAVVCDRSRAVFVERDVNLPAIACERFVYGVVDGFEHDLMQAAHARVADVHARPSADALKTFEDFDLLSAVLVRIAAALL